MYKVIGQSIDNNDFSVYVISQFSHIHIHMHTRIRLSENLLILRFENILEMYEMILEYLYRLPLYQGCSMMYVIPLLAMADLNTASCNINNNTVKGN